VLACLADDWTPGRIVEMFKSESDRRAIFRPLRWSEREDGALPFLLRQMLSIPRYATEPKREHFRRVLRTGDLPLDAVAAAITAPRADTGLGASAPTHLLICAFHYDRRRAIFFRSDPFSPASGLPARAPVTLADAVHASTNAPVRYFKDPALTAPAPGRAGASGGATGGATGGAGELAPTDATRCWDGGVAAFNNPIMAGLIEAKSAAQTLGGGATRVRVLSIGTGTTERPPASDAPRGMEDSPLFAPAVDAGMRADLEHLATAVLADPPDAATFQAHVLMGGGLPREMGTHIRPADLVRLNPMVQGVFESARGWGYPEGIALGNESPREAFEALVNLDMDAVRQEDVERIERFGRAWIDGRVRNQLIRGDTERTKWSIGHPTFEEGRRAW
jgi:hypothetical protein